jgi:hypothetical protein
MAGQRPVPPNRTIRFCTCICHVQSDVLATVLAPARSHRAGWSCHHSLSLRRLRCHEPSTRAGGRRHGEWAAVTRGLERGRRRPHSACHALRHRAPQPGSTGQDAGRLPTGLKPGLLLESRARPMHCNPYLLVSFRPTVRASRYRLSGKHNYEVAGEGERPLPWHEPAQPGAGFSFPAKRTDHGG